MTPPQPDPNQVADIIDSLRAAGEGQRNAGLDQMAAALQALAAAGPEAWAQLDGLLHDPEALARYLQSFDGAEDQSQGGVGGAAQPGQGGQT